jgi:hypothetical protein
MIGALPLVGTLLMFPPALQCDRPQEDAGTEDAGL